MMKHVGLHNAQKVTIVLHQMPAEEHMCLVMYDDKLPPRYFQAVKACVNSESGQASKDFATALEGVLLEDGRNLARVLFTEGHLKKVPANQVFATPYGYESANKIKLNELNEYMNKIDQGGEALQKLKEFDEHKGMQRKKRAGQIELNEYGMPAETLALPALPPAPPREVAPQAAAVLAIDAKEAGDALRSQVEILRASAVQLLNQAKLLGEKAEQIFPTLEKRKPGRPKGTVKLVK